MLERSKGIVDNQVRQSYHREVKHRLLYYCKRGCLWSKTQDGPYQVLNSVTQEISHCGAENLSKKSHKP